MSVPIRRVVFILEAIERKAPLLGPDDKLGQDPNLLRQYRSVLSSQENINPVVPVILEEKENILIVKPAIKILLSFINGEDDLFIPLIP